MAAARARGSVRPMNLKRSLLLVLAAVLLVPAGADAQTKRASMQSCGDVEAKGVLIGDLLQRRSSCTTAKAVAREVPGKCRSGSCEVRGYTCLVGEATAELKFARCTQAKGDDELYRTIRFDYGS